MISKRENSVKIICKNNDIRYFCRNDNDSWTEVTGSVSKLSRKRLKCTSFIERGDEIIDAIYDEYGLDNYTVNIFFIGDDENYSALEAVAKKKSDRIYVTHMKKERLIVAGYSDAGKSTLINALNGNGVLTRSSNSNNLHTVYGTDFCSDAYYEVHCYEEPNADKKNKENIEELLHRGITAIVFCVNSRVKMNIREIETILYIRKAYPHIKITVVLTKYTLVDDDILRTYAKELGGIKIFSILAVDYSLRGGAVIPAYGVEELARYLFGDSVDE